MDKYFTKIFSEYEEINARYDAENKAIWCYYKPTGRPCFSLTMLKELRLFQQRVIDYFDNKDDNDESLIEYQVLHSQIYGIFNMGGDLNLFSKLIVEQNREKLLEYALACVDICYLNAINYHQPLTTISLVEGSALGGGFESALSSNILIATKDSELGFPEIRFNLFPGMGAYSLLARRCGIPVAEKIITSGDIYSAEELFELGVIQHLAEPGEALETVKNFIKRHKQLGNGFRAIQQAGLVYHPITYEELASITEIWVDAALRLKKKDLRLIGRLVKAQTAKVAPKEGSTLTRTYQDRRFIDNDISFPLADWNENIIHHDRRKTDNRRD